MKSLNCIKFKLIVCLCILINSSGKGQQPWIWSRAATGTNAAGEGMSVASDQFGNAYITGGYYSSSITFGNFTLNNPSGSYQVYLVKYDSSGNVLWAKTSESTPAAFYGNQGIFVNVDNSGDVLLAGSFATTEIYFDSDTLINNGFYNMFIVKFDSNGNVIWAKSEGTSNLNSVTQAYCVDKDATDNIYVVGSSDDSVITIGNNQLTGNGFDDIILIKYDFNANVIWAKNFGGTGTDMGQSISIDNNYNIYITGRFSSPFIIFGQDTLFNDTTQSTNRTDIFLAKLDSGGNPLWAIRSGGKYDDNGFSVAAYNNDAVFLTGSFLSPTIQFDTITLTHAGAGWEDVFVASFDGSGNVKWAQSAGGTKRDWGCTLSLDPKCNVYLAGGFESDSITFGSFTLFKQTGNCTTVCDNAFIVKYDSLGSVLCADGLASGGDDQIGVAADAFGDVYVSGDYAVNPFIVGNDTFPLNGAENIFVSKYNCNNPLGIQEQSIFSDIHVYPNPSSDVVFVEVKSGTEKKLEFILYNLLGLELKRIEISKSTHLNIGDFINGVYIWQIYDGGNLIRVGKILKKD